MKNLIKLAISIIVMLVAVYFIYDYYKDKTITGSYQNITNIDSSSKFIADLKDEHKNNEIVMYLEIPDVVGIAIPQTDNNEYYLTHNIDKKEDKNGTPFLDYRNKSLNDKKLIVYGHNDAYKNLPFSRLLDYQKEDFYKEHSKVHLYYDGGKRVYRIFSYFTEKEDFDYVNIYGFNDITFYEHILKLKDKSFYDTGTKIDGESKILVIQTSTFDDNYNGDTKYQIIAAIEEK